MHLRKKRMLTESDSHRLQFETTQIIRDHGLQGFYRLNHLQLGPLAGEGRFGGSFNRDRHRFTRMALAHPENLAIPELLPALEAGIHTQFAFQGKESDPLTNEEPGAIHHELRIEGLTPVEEIENLIAQGWPYKVDNQGRRVICVYAAGDTTGGAISEVAQMARAKELLARPSLTSPSTPESLKVQKEFLDKYYLNTLKAYTHQIKLMDRDQDGLLETPSNTKTLKFQTEKDGGLFFTDENGKAPQPPYYFLSNNAYALDGIKEFGWITHTLGKTDLAEKALDRYQKGKIKLKQKFWMKEHNYPTPLLHGKDKQQLQFISDEALDPMWCGLWSREDAHTIANRLNQSDMVTPFGYRPKEVSLAKKYPNEAEAYWGGLTVWLHRTGIAAESFALYGMKEYEKVADLMIANYILEEKIKELIVVDEQGWKSDYTEKGIPKACMPQLFGVGTALARTAEIYLPLAA